MHHSIRLAAAAAGLLLAALPAAPGAHVTLQPETLPADAFTCVDVRVPNERHHARTTEVSVRFPPGFVFLSTEPVPGWTARVERVALDAPVEEFGESFDERVGTLTLTAAGRGICPGEFQDLGLSLKTPDAPGTELTFPAVQAYSDGEVVRWIGAPDAESPAARVRLTAAEAAADAPAGAAPAAAVGEDDPVLPLIRGDGRPRAAGGRRRPRAGAAPGAGALSAARPGTGRRATARRAVLALLAAVVVLAMPAAALGHAIVVHTHPSRAAQLDVPPWYVSVQFNEPVEMDDDSVRVYDAGSERVDKGGAYRAEGDASAGVRLGEMEDGLYTVVYRVVSADGHPVSGGFPFGVGVPVGPAATPGVGELLGDTTADGAVEAVYGAVRGVHYAARCS